MLPQFETTLIIFAVIIVLVGLARNLAEMIKIWRRDPSIDKELTDYVLKVEHERDIAVLKADYLDRFRKMDVDSENQWVRINGESKTNSTYYKDLERAIGRLEGKIDGLRPGGPQ